MTIGGIFFTVCMLIAFANSLDVWTTEGVLYDAWSAKTPRGFFAAVFNMAVTVVGVMVLLYFVIINWDVKV